MPAGELECPALFVSAVASGEGKTSVTAAIARLHSRAGRKVRIFKTGPDFLDPRILERTSGTPVFNVDAWMVGITQSRELLFEAAADAELILIEGAMGLFDGEPSAADLAVALGVPIATVIDASAMAQTFGAVAHGLQSYRAVPFLGVIANRVAGATHARMLADSLPQDVQLLAALPRLDKTLPERHLGLVSDASHDPLGAIDALADAMHGCALAGLPAPVAFRAEPRRALAPLLAGRTIAVARDDAFCFIYPANLRCLIELGARLEFFSPINNDTIPRSDALYLPGGYPELHADVLERNDRWRASVRSYADSRSPIVAECGGMMSICEKLVTNDGVTYSMAGLLPATVRMTDRVAAIGLQSLQLPQGELRGHTFHHSTLQTSVQPALMATALRYGQGEALYRLDAITASYVHAYFPSNPAATAALFGEVPR